MRGTIKFKLEYDNDLAIVVSTMAEQVYTTLAYADSEVCLRVKWPIATVLDQLRRLDSISDS